MNREGMRVGLPACYYLISIALQRHTVGTVKLKLPAYCNFPKAKLDYGI
jgi:hypothetical protein